MHQQSEDQKHCSLVGWTCLIVLEIGLVLALESQAQTSRTLDFILNPVKTTTAEISLNCLCLDWDLFVNTVIGCKPSCFKCSQKNDCRIKMVKLIWAHSFVFFWFVYENLDLLRSIWEVPMAFLFHILSRFVHHVGLALVLVSTVQSLVSFSTHSGLGLG